ncbi:MAG: hypothetical protein L0H53_00495 [Candidatus Nitrosocosmicus sp.]|nr:hypothetical protein [Candidatus Nitrosocosmicus sp.]MDN5866015.1 hypothetical protein [Candidatus Nitrosocosmicus sp.]
MNNLLKLDSISHLSFDRKNGLLLGKGLTKGSEFEIKIETDSGGDEHIKAGKIPVIIYGSTHTDNNKRRHIKNNGNYRQRLLLNRVNGMLTKSHNDSSSSAQGNLHSE